MATAKLKSLNHVHPLVLFWLGLLTGAIVVGLVFFYRVLTPTDYQGASFYWSKWSPYTTTTSLDLNSSISPNMYDPKGSISPNM